ncbi:nuclear transport factor 2 family protein [Amycolatopsis sp. NPDC059027]|uniref:nuclear transport factor 2 family protein n=1 Tax=unclassified Amycolatopsis TaxID=2618356 RepID=UPI00367253DC
MLDIQEISDRLEIQDLVVAYATAVDGRDFDALDRIFADDAYLDYTAFGGVTGNLAVVKKWIAQNLAQLPAIQHLIANPDIRVDGDRATGRVMCLNPIALPAEDGEPPVAMLGLWYLDEYVRTPQGWRISRRDHQRSWSQGLGGH